MALNDLTGQNIQDTYQKVVQTDGTNLADGTGSALPIKFDGPDLIVSGALRAQSYIVSESIVNVSSGSTAFGDSADDSHTFTLSSLLCFDITKGLSSITIFLDEAKFKNLISIIFIKILILFKNKIEL